MPDHDHQPEEPSSAKQENQLPEDLSQQCALLQQRLSKRTQQRDQIKARYQALATQVSQAKSHERGFRHLDDSHLVGLTQGLRIKIWNFAIQHYEGTARAQTVRDPSRDALLARYMQTTIRLGADLQWYLESPTWRPIIIEAFLWKLIVGRIFYNFWWAGDAGHHLGAMYTAVQRNFANSPEDIQKFQRWSATTTDLIQESQKRAGDLWSSGHTEQDMKVLVTDVYRAIDAYRTSAHGGLKTTLYDILHSAIELDQEICQQVAYIEWEFPQPEDCDYNPKRMEVIEGEQPPRDTDAKEVSIVICPGIKKRGRSTGEEFGKVESLMRIKVSCEVPEDEWFSGDDSLACEYRNHHR